jgi:uncharacterized membrane protein
MPLKNLHLTADDGWDLGAVVITASVLVLTISNVHSPIRGLLALTFLTAVPGWAVVSNWPRFAARSRAALSVLFSLSICIVVATVSLWAELWHPLGLFDLCAAATGLALFRSLWYRHREPQATTTVTTAVAS